MTESAYGPGNERDDNERDQFWNELRDCVDSFGDNVNITVFGDLNARVGNTGIVVHEPEDRSGSN